MKDYKPEGYTSLAPYFVVKDANKLIAFTVAVFDAERLRMVPGDDGRVRHGEVRIDDTVLMLADAMEQWPARPADVHVYVRDVNTLYSRALEHGAESVQEPAQKHAGDDRRGGFRFAGITWWVATQMNGAA
jgi:PhnB protein